VTPALVDARARLVRSPSTGAVEASDSAHFHLGRLGRNPDGVAPVEGLRMSRAYEHRPVMVAEVTAVLAGAPPGLVVDATVGGGGHAAALLRAAPHLRLLGVDRDPAAVAAATAALAPFGGRARVVQGRFSGLAALARRAAGGPPPVPVTGVLFDLGVSSAQLDDPGRGFSYRHDGPLDMRMDPGGPRTAADLVNEASVDELAALFAEHGEQRFARRVATAVVEARPIATTGQLADVVRRAIPAAARRRGRHPAQRVFQALRAAVNDEVTELEAGLDAALELLAPGGRLVVLSYHSGEDRVVKRRFLAAATGGCSCPPRLPCVCGATPTARLLSRGALRPSAAEVRDNPRAASARLRALERLAAPDGAPEP
jgi:16S rRNA (cytosine1402-N4)-methyltransferase